MIYLKIYLIYIKIFNKFIKILDFLHIFEEIKVRYFLFDKIKNLQSWLKSNNRLIKNQYNKLDCISTLSFLTLSQLTTNGKGIKQTHLKSIIRITVQNGRRKGVRVRLWWSRIFLWTRLQKKSLQLSHRYVLCKHT